MHRQLAESTTTTILDQLIAENPQRLEFYRTRGIVHCFRDEYALAVKDFTHALKESRAVRKAHNTHTNGFRTSVENHPKGKRKKGKVNGQAPPSGTSPAIEGPDGEHLLLHPSVLPDAPDPLEPQVLFHRGAAYLAHAVFLIEDAVCTLENIQKEPLGDAAELRLSYLEGARYGGTEAGNPDGPLGRSDGAKARAYRAVLAEESFRAQIGQLLRKSKRDHERFLAHFDTLEADSAIDDDETLPQKLDRAFLLLEAFRPNSRSVDRPPSLPDVPLSFTTYHPLMVESHFSVLICLLLLGDFQVLLGTFEQTANLVAGLEGYPVFLPPRSMAQAEFIETLERLAGGWKYCKLSNALVRLTPRQAPMNTTATRTPSPLLIHSWTGNDRSGASSSAGPSTANSAKTPSQSGRATPESEDDAGRIDLREALDYVRILLAPVIARQQERAERAAAAKAAGTDKKKPAPINIPLHGPRVEVFLAWLGAVHLPELETVAT